jgi:hypothetical protein
VEGEEGEEGAAEAVAGRELGGDGDTAVDSRGRDGEADGSSEPEDVEHPTTAASVPMVTAT